MEAEQGNGAGLSGQKRDATSMLGALAQDQTNPASVSVACVVDVCRPARSPVADRPCDLGELARPIHMPTAP
eukprot:363885-Chlamydomonas_euryale.AAC.10